MPLSLKVQTELDRDSLRGVEDEARSAFDGIGEIAGGQFLRGLSSGMGGVGDVFSSVVGSAESMGAGISGAAVTATAGIAAIGAAAVIVGEQLYAVGERWDAVADSISVRTGKIGADLDALTNSVRTVADNSASSIEAIGDVAGRVSQAFDVVGAPLEDLTSKIANLDRMTGESTNIRELGLVLRGFNLDAASAGDALDALYAVSQQTGIPVNELLGSLQALGPAARSLNLDMGDTVGVIESFNDASIDADKTVAGLNRAAMVFAQNNIDMTTGLRDTVIQIRDFIAAGNDAAAVDLAGKVFGTRSAQQFVDAVRNGKLGVDDLRSSLTTMSSDDAINKMDRQTRDWAENWEILKNRISGIAENVGGPLFDAFNKVLGVVLDIGTAVPKIQPGAPGDTSPNALGDLLGAPPAPVLKPGDPGFIGPVPVGPGSLPGSIPMPFLVPSNRPPAPPPQDVYGALADDAKKSGASRPNIPSSQYSLDAVPFGSFPGEVGGAPVPVMSSVPTGPGYWQVDPQKVFSAETSVMSARTAVENARARLLELQQKDNVTEQELHAAKENLITTGRQLQSAEANLVEAQQGTWKKLTDSTRDISDGMDDIGAALDKDLGISRGLPGLADNLVKFLANLAAAPVLGALAGAREGLGGTQGGGGLVGIGTTLAGMYPGGPLDQNRGSYSSGSYSPVGSYSPSTGGLPAALPGGQRVPYGLPADANSGGYGSGGVDFPDWVDQLAAAFGIQPSTYSGHQTSNRNEPGFAPNPLGQNRGIDWSGPVANMQAFADYLAANPGVAEQVIWQNPQTGQRLGIAGGRNVTGSNYYSGDYGAHGSHVHTRQSSSIPLPPWLQAASYDDGGLLMPGVTLAVNDTGQPEQVSPIGGAEPPAGRGGGVGGGGKGFGNTGIGGAVAGSAISAGAAALDAMAPGAGQAAAIAANIAIQEITRAIGFGAQAAGIGVQGLMETFLPTGASELANNNWLTRIAGGIVGAAPAIPNLAGKAATTAMMQQLTPDQVKAMAPAMPPPGVHTGSRQPPGPTNQQINVNYNNIGATEDRAGADLTYHLSQAQLPAGSR